ncbi:PAS domain-containing protein [Algoriphagus mannitolivorans]|uniref:hypothetical protein n=1 Tax=Algoriphagus mannitolivorans TaxID=226504 RepID=UPI00040A57E2|nr:hypothetical protein [Algoriphagus mannitolivorans]
MDSGHFQFVILDVEGRVLRRNRSFEKMNPDSLGKEFWKFLSLETAEEFCYSLELMLSTPKVRRHLMLEHSSSKDNLFSQIWWEFSIVTNLEMDISAVIGIGVGLQFLEQEMPWNNLVDVLGFGRISLDKNFRILSWDERISHWFSDQVKDWSLKALIQTHEFGEEPVVLEGLHSVLDTGKPFCFLLDLKQYSENGFAALLAPAPEGYHFFLVPKEDQDHGYLNKKIFSDRDLELIQGSVIILDKEGLLIQQNEEARKFAKEFFGHSLEPGTPLRLSKSNQKFIKFSRAIEGAKKGISMQFEQNLFVSKNEIRFWEVSVRPFHDFKGDIKGIMIQLLDISGLKKQIFTLHKEIDRLREISAIPSHIYRGPLSSMIGILELIDENQLGKENKKLFGYLKPLALELDQSIRLQAKANRLEDFE